MVSHTGGCYGHFRLYWCLLLVSSAFLYYLFLTEKEMKNSALLKDKIFSRNDLRRQVERWKLLNKKIVFTNGCFDILHKGHIELLSKAATLGDILIVGLNAD